MSGKVPLSKRAQIRHAAELYSEFSGHDADEFQMVQKPVIPDVLTVIGELEGVIYSTVRDNEAERYIHKFRAKSRPMLCVGPDGNQLFLIGGSYHFTERGIVDK
jgi:hypothetical protein